MISDEGLVMSDKGLVEKYKYFYFCNGLFNVVN